MTYAELIAKLEAAEKATGLYLSDKSVDEQNAGPDATDSKLFAVAANAAGQRAEAAGKDINELVGASIY